MLANNELQARMLLFPFAASAAIKFVNAGKRFVHYCSADAATNILSNESVWMRNARLMNDFSEIEYGTKCLQAALNSSQGSSLKGLLQNSHPVLSPILDDLGASLPSIRDETYILCLSEHERAEDQTGRLSMWRGYGGDLDSTAIILNANAIVAMPDISPVAYLTENEFLQQFSAVVQSFPRIISLLSNDVTKLREILMTAFTFAIMCTKHPGFHEEKEWRLVFRPNPASPAIMTKSVVSQKGFPEVIYQIPLKNRPDLNISGIEVRDLVDRVIIGPSDRADDLRRHFVALLTKKGVLAPEQRVIASNIPFRKTITPPQ